jgi:hypothetical protein
MEREKIDLKVSDIRVWSDVVGSVNKKAWMDSLRMHDLKMQKFREQKKY